MRAASCYTIVIIRLRITAVRSTDVIDQVLLVIERLVAHVARVRRVARVLSQVIGEVLFAGERLLAELAAMRRVARVNPGGGKY